MKMPFVGFSNDEAMSQMAKIALEQATTQIAEFARTFAETMPPGISGKDALKAFADAIESTNAKTFTKGPRQ